MDATPLDEDAFKSIARLPTRDVLNGQFAGVVASPLTGLVRGLGSMIQGLASQLGQIADQGLVTGQGAQETPDTSETTSQSDSSSSSEVEPDAEQADTDPAAPGSEAEDAGGNDAETSDSNEEEG
jgi:hypothetical protein